MTSAQRLAISSPPEGLLVWDTTAHSLYSFSGLHWEPMAAGGETANVFSWNDDMVSAWVTIAEGRSRGWFWQNLPSGSGVAPPAGRVGINRITRSSTTAAYAQFAPGGPTSPGGEFALVQDIQYVRMDLSMVSDLTLREFQFGLSAMNNLSGATFAPTHGAAFTFQVADHANWRTVTSLGSHGTPQDSGVTVVEDTWYKLELLRVGNDIKYYINDALVRTDAINTIDSTPVSAFLRLRTTSASSRSYDIDLFRFQTFPLTR
jgi:hypothetical protein